MTRVVHISVSVIVYSCRKVYQNLTIGNKRDNIHAFYYM